MAYRIDKFLVSEDIARGIGEISASVLLATRSDHWHIRLQWDWSNHPIKKLLRFEQFGLNINILTPWFGSGGRSWSTPWGQNVPIPVKIEGS